MKLIKPDIVIGLSGNNWQLKLVHKHFFKKYPFIYAPYDIISHFFNSRKEALTNGVKEFEINAEKYCLENSDGILHKGDPNEINLFNGKDFYKANVKKPQLTFHPYCLNDFITPINNNKLSKKDKEIHLVYPGFFLLNKPQNIDSILKTLKTLLDQKIHIHIYGKVTHISKNKSEKYFKEIFRKYLKNKYLHLHNPLGPKEIVKEISKYDFGFYWSHIFGYPEVGLHTSNKISTFLEAGIPMYYHEDCHFVDKLMSSYNLKLSYNEKSLLNLKREIKELDYKKLINHIKKARNDFNTDKNFPRLENFIKKVISLKHKSQNTI